MKPMILAFVAMAVISYGASFTLHQLGFASDEQTRGNAVRLD